MRPSPQQVLIGWMEMLCGEWKQHSYKLTDRFTGHKLGTGRYVLSLQTVSGKSHSKAVTLKLRIQ